MSDKPISVGDLVVVVGQHCSAMGADWLGDVYTVTGDIQSALPRCGYCGGSVHSARIVSFDTGGRWLPVQYLKRIPPLDELEGVRQDEEISA